LPNLHLDFSRVGVLGATGFSLAAPSLSGSKQARLKALSDEAARLKRICSAQNAIACVNNVTTSQELLQLGFQGVRIIAGPVVGGPTELPGPTQRLSFGENSAGASIVAAS